MEKREDNALLAGREWDDLMEFLPERGWMDVDAGRWRFAKTRPLREDIYTLTYRGVPFAPLGDIHALTGKSGNGKTMAFTALMAALLGVPQGGLRCSLPAGKAGKVVYVDTEMGVNDTNKVVKRVYTMMGWSWGEERGELEVYRLREVADPAERWRVVLKAMYDQRPDVLFIDGMLDLVGDFNDNAECRQLVGEVMAMATRYGASVWCLLHENPGTDKMAGHLGTSLERKVTEVYVAEKHKENGAVWFELSQKKARGNDIPNITFRVQPSDSGLWVPVIDELPFAPPQKPAIPEQEKAGTAEVREWLRGEIRANGMSTRELQQLIVGKKHFGKTKAGTFIAQLVAEGVLYRADNKRYYLGDNATQTTFNMEGGDDADNNGCPF